MDYESPVGTGPYGGVAQQWRDACTAVNTIPKENNARARAFFESYFTPYATSGEAGPTGRFTGYYVQPLRGSMTRGGRYQFPLYKRPDDLVAIRLNDFIDDGRSRRIWGRLDDNGKLKPYPTRAEFLANKKNSNRDDVLLWLDSPADAVLVEIEGSGNVTLKDGSQTIVAFAGKNGRRSEKRGAARALRRLERQHGNRRWNKRDLARISEITATKASIVFFEISNRAGAVGSQNVVLTKRRSLAVDRALVPLSTPIWIDTTAPPSATSEHQPWRHLVIAQDTGGAIVGSVRGDIYWGDDREAEQIGRRVNGPGRMWLLLPKGIELTQF